jgi:outer membrane cobalamin receptor
MRTSHLAWTAAAIVLLCRSVSAATISGRVVDPNGQPVSSAHVVVTSSALGTVADQETDQDGRYAIAALAAGAYEVRVVRDGFDADPVRALLNAEEARTVDVALRLSALRESIVVSAAQVDLPLSRAADTVTVVTSRDIETRQIETIGDALRLVPDLAVTRSGGRGAITSLFPRGGASNYTLVLVDGVRVNSFGGGYDFGHLGVADIDRIEVVRGPESALFGSDAIGSVVQIVTKRGGKTRGDASIEGGSQGTERFAASGAGSNGPWSWGGAAEQEKSDGFTGIAPASGETVSNDDDHLRRVDGSIGWQKPNGADVFVTGALARDERGFPGPFGSNPAGNFSGVDRVSRGINDRRQLGGRVTNPWSDRVRQRIDVNVYDLSSHFTSAFGPSDSGTRRYDGRVQEDVAVSTAVAFSGGVELTRERGTSSFIANPIERTVTGTFGEFRYVATERLFVTGGARLEHLSRSGQDSIDSFNPKIAASYVVGSTRLHASAGTGIRPPDAFEIAFTDNPNLKPERSRSVDGGVERRLANGAAAIGATAFFNRYDDLIVSVGRSLRDASQFKTDNISNAESRGIEVTFDARPSSRVAVHANYTFVDSQILSVDGLVGTAPPPFKVGDALLRRPRHQGTVDVAFTQGRLSAFADLTTRSQVLDVEPNFGASGGLFFNPGYAFGNVGATVRVARQLDVFARVINVTDRVYEEAFGFPALRRSAIAGVRVAAGR